MSGWEAWPTGIGGGQILEQYVFETATADYTWVMYFPCSDRCLLRHRERRVHSLHVQVHLLAQLVCFHISTMPLATKRPGKVAS